MEKQFVGVLDYKEQELSIPDGKVLTISIILHSVEPRNWFQAYIPYFPHC